MAAIFGDVFQLLDRDKDGEGEYSISIGSEWGSWLKKTLKDIDDETKKKYFPYSDNQYKICLPSNLYLLATMNTADQGLFPMDSAFKRRWFMKYIGMNHAEDSELHFKVPVQIGKKRKNGRTFAIKSIKRFWNIPRIQTSVWDPSLSKNRSSTQMRSVKRYVQSCSFLRSFIICGLF